MPGRLDAAKAVFTGRCPVVEKEKIVTVEKIIHLRTTNTRKRSEASNATLDISRSWTDKRPHPTIMGELNTLNKDPELETAITIMSEMVASGFYTEMGEKVPKQTDAQGKEITHPNKLKIDEWNEDVNADEKFGTAVRVMFEKGFCAIELLPDENYDLKVLPSETMFFWRNKTGQFMKYTQEVGGSEVAHWEGEKDKDIIWLANKATPENPYGKAMAESLQDYLKARRQMTQDGPAVLHKIGYPLRRWEAQSKTVMDSVFNQATTRNPDEDLFIDGVGEGDLRVVTEETNARINFEGFLTSNNALIAEGLFSPSINYLHNATQASADKILEAIDRHVQGVQRYVKRRVEKYAFARIIGTAGGPVPRMVWGLPKSGVEDITYGDVAQLYSSGAITQEQTQDLLKKLGLPLKDIPLGQQPMLPSLKDMPLLDQTRMTTLQASLDVIEKNWKAKTIGISDAFREGTRAIDVHIKAAKAEAIRKLNQSGIQCTQLSPESENCFTVIKAEITSRFRERILPHGAHANGEPAGKRYTVIAR